MASLHNLLYGSCIVNFTIIVLIISFQYNSMTLLCHLKLRPIWRYPHNVLFLAHDCYADQAVQLIVCAFLILASGLLVSQL